MPDIGVQASLIVSVSSKEANESGYVWNIAHKSMNETGHLLIDFGLCSVLHTHGGLHTPSHSWSVEA